jgi:hypothetical protein
MLTRDIANDRLYVDARSFRLRNTVWDDLRILPTTFDFAGNADPVVVGYQPGGSGTTFRLYEFAVNDEGFFTVQMPHAWKVGTALYPHVHWTPGARGNEEAAKVVGWNLDYSIASINGLFYASRTISLASACTGTDHYHEISGGGSMPMDGIGLSAMILGRLYRTGTGDTWSSTSSGQLPLLLELDFHYEIDSLGSDDERAKG